MSVLQPPHSLRDAELMISPHICSPFREMQSNAGLVWNSAAVKSIQDSRFHKKS